jgi:hypothetical protein
MTQVLNGEDTVTALGAKSATEYAQHIQESFLFQVRGEEKLCKFC